MHNPEDRSFIGHPRGLGYIAFTEAWERFSYYGMQTLLVLYITHRLLLPGHVEHVAGFGPFRNLLEAIYRGQLDIQPLASAIFGLYTGLVYVTPIAGGLLADRFLGRTSTITIESRPPHCPLPSLVSITWPSLRRITSWVGSAGFWRECQRQISGFCTQRSAEQP